MKVKGIKNVLGGELQVCSTAPLTGYFRNGYCANCPEDMGVHVVCAQVTEAFLAYSRSRGNDLVTPQPRFNFTGLKPGDRWCLCAGRWMEAQRAGVAPPLYLEGTHEAMLQYLSLDELKQYALTNA